MLIAVYLVLGFMLAWVVGIVAKEEIEVKTGVIIMVVAGVVGLGAKLALAGVAPDMVEFAGLAIDFVVLTVVTNMFAHIGWKNSVIVALICSLLLLAVGMGLRAMLAT